MNINLDSFGPKTLRFYTIDPEAYRDRFFRNDRVRLISRASLKSGNTTLDPDKVRASIQASIRDQPIIELVDTSERTVTLVLDQAAGCVR